MAQPLTNTVSRGIRPAMQLIYDLRTCGVERDVDIPQVAVIGDQSSGKVRERNQLVFLSPARKHS